MRMNFEFYDWKGILLLLGLSIEGIWMYYTHTKDENGKQKTKKNYGWSRKMVDKKWTNFLTVSAHTTIYIFL